MTLRPANTTWRSLYPFESHHLTIDGFRYHYLDEGQGPPLLMVHGNPTWSFYYRQLITGLRDKWRAIAPDHIGCGLSDKPRDYPYCLQQHIDNLCRLVRTLGLSNATLLAHDWGGAIGLGTVLAEPQRFSRLVLFNTGAFTPRFCPLRIRVCRIPLLGQFAIQGLNLFARAATVMAVGRGKHLSSEVRAGLLAPYDSWGHRVAIHRFVQDIPLSPSHSTWKVLEHIERGLPSLADRPIQLIWGMQDWCFDSRCLKMFVDVFPRAQVHRLEDAGHYVVEDAAEEILPLLRQFLEQTS
jgi:haloalkane dehalogenase